MFIKICANTNLQDALLAAQLGADAVGFVFAPSKRRVTVEEVAAITPHLPAGVEAVGVFTTTEAAEILETAARTGLTMVQLHSAFDPGLLQSLDAGRPGGLRVLQVVDVAEDHKLPELETHLRAALRHTGVEAVLLDTAHGGSSGGTGRVFDWERTAGMVRAFQGEAGGRVIVAGGLRAENVAAAIRMFAPWGVDVASGVEAEPGRKDPARLKAFLESARAGSRIEA